MLEAPSLTYRLGVSFCGTLGVCDACPASTNARDILCKGYSIVGWAEQCCQVLGFADEQFLGEGHSLQLQLHAQVATSHHQRLGLGDDAVDVGQSLRLIRPPESKTMAAGFACVFCCCALGPLACGFSIFGQIFGRFSCPYAINLLVATAMPSGVSTCQRPLA